MGHIGARKSYGIRAFKHRPRLQPLDIAFLAKVGQPLGQPCDRLFLPAPDPLDVNCRLVKRDAHGFGPGAIKDQFRQEKEGL